MVDFLNHRLLKLNKSSISCTHGNNEVTNHSRIPNWRQFFCWYFLKKGWSLTPLHSLLLYFIWKINICCERAWKEELDHIKIFKDFNIFSMKTTVWNFVPFPGGLIFQKFLNFKVQCLNGWLFFWFQNFTILLDLFSIKFSQKYREKSTFIEN